LSYLKHLIFKLSLIYKRAIELESTHFSNFILILSFTTFFHFFHFIHSFFLLFLLVEKKCLSLKILYLKTVYYICITIVIYLILLFIYENNKQIKYLSYYRLYWSHQVLKLVLTYITMRLFGTAISMLFDFLYQKV